MSKADKMLLELGYEKIHNTYIKKVSEEEELVIMFNGEHLRFQHMWRYKDRHLVSAIDKNLLIAIVAKILELEEESNERN